jgi:phytoene dehydrogenase-like protein
VTGIDFPLEEPVTIGGQKWKQLGVQIYNFDPSLAPAGKTMVRIMFASNYQNYKELQKGPERYRAKKERIADQVVTLLDRRFPGLVAQVEMRGVATPMTFERYTGNWQSSFEGWLISSKTLRMLRSKTLPELRNFYMSGQRVEPGGSLPPALLSGRYATQIICKRDKRSFITKIP